MAFTKARFPLVSPTSSYHCYLHGIYIGVLCNAKPRCSDPLSLMLSIAVWCQMMDLSEYEVNPVRCGMHGTIVRGAATTHPEVTKLAVPWFR